MLKRVVSMLLAVAVIVTCTPDVAFAAAPQNAPQTSYFSGAETEDEEDLSSANSDVSSNDDENVDPKDDDEDTDDKDIDDIDDADDEDEPDISGNDDDITDDDDDDKEIEFGISPELSIELDASDSVRLFWTIDDLDLDDNIDYIEGPDFRLYESEDADDWSLVSDDFGTATNDGYKGNVTADLDLSTGRVVTRYYKLVPVYQDTDKDEEIVDEDGTSNIVCTDDVTPGTITGSDKYDRFVIIDEEGNEITSLDLEIGAAPVQIRPAIKDKNGKVTPVTYDDNDPVKDLFPASGNNEVLKWTIKSATEENVNSLNDNIVSAEDSPIDLELAEEEDIAAGSLVNISAKDSAEEGVQYFVEVAFTATSKSGTLRVVRIPVVIGGVSAARTGGKVSIDVPTYGGDGGGQQVFYADMDEALASLNDPDGPWAPKNYKYSIAHINIVLYDDVNITQDWSIPNFITSVSFSCEELRPDNYFFNLNGHDLRLENVTECGIYDGFQFISSGAKSTITITSGNPNVTFGGDTYKDSESKIIVDNVDFILEKNNSAGQYGISFFTFFGKQGASYKISNSNLTGDQLTTYGGDWTVDNLNLKYLTVGSAHSTGYWDYDTNSHVSSYDPYTKSTLTAGIVNVTGTINSRGEVFIYNTTTVEELNLDYTSLEVQNLPDAAHKSGEVLSNTPVLTADTINVTHKQQYDSTNNGTINIRDYNPGSAPKLNAGSIEMEEGSIFVSGNNRPDQIYLTATDIEMHQGAGKLSIYNGRAEVTTAFLQTLEMNYCGVLDVVNLTVAENLYLYLQCGINVENSADFSNVLLGQTTSNKVSQMQSSLRPFITRLSDTDIRINNSVSVASPDSILDIKTLDLEGNLIKTNYGTVVLVTDITTFPIDQFHVIQPADYLDYDVVIQDGDAIKVSKKPIKVVAIQDAGRTDLLSFMRWNDAINYINNNANKDTSYVIHLNSDVWTGGNLTFPSNCASITVECDSFMGCELSFVGDVKLTTDLTFNNVKLTSKVYNKSTKDYDDNPSTNINLNGKVLTLVNAVISNRSMGTVSGTGKSAFIYHMSVDSDIDMFFTGNFATVDLILEGAENHGIYLHAKDIKATGDTYLKNSIVESDSNVTFTNLHSFSEGNEIRTGRAAANKLSVTGTVDALSPNGVNCGHDHHNVDVLGTDGAGGDHAVINSCAVNLRSQYLDNLIAAKPDGDDKTKGYGAYEKQVLAVSPKMPITFLVVGLDYDEDEDEYAVQYLLKKDAKGNFTVNTAAVGDYIPLYRVDAGGDEILGYFSNLQLALSEIDKYADKNASYRIELPVEVAADGIGKYSTVKANLTMPKQLHELTIVSADDTDIANLYMNNAFNINSNVFLENIDIHPATNAKLNISIGGFTFKMDRSRVCGTIGNLTGNGVKGTSTFIYKWGIEKGNMVGFRPTGNIQNVGNVVLDGACVEATGSVNIGNLIAANESGLDDDKAGGYLMGTATVKLDTKKHKIVSITPNIVINGQIIKEHPDNYLGIGLWTNVANAGGYLGIYGSMQILGDDYCQSYEEFASTNGISLAKAINADASVVSAYFLPDAPSSIIVKKAGYLTYYTGISTVNYVLESGTDSVPCMTFADAVTEINNRNNKNADYTIRLFGDENHNVNTKDNPIDLKMPASGKYASLTIMPNAGTDQVNLYYGTKSGNVIKAVNGLTLTGNTTIKYVNFIDAEADANKVNGDYPFRAPFVLSLAAKELDVTDVYFKGRAVGINGGGKTGRLVIGSGNKGFGAAVEPDALASGGVNVIEGTITNLPTLVLPQGDVLLMNEYISNAKGTKAAPSLTVTSLICDSNTIQVAGSIAITDLNVVNDDTAKTVISADKDFKITGIVNVIEEDGLVLIGRQKNDRTKTPFLTMGGTMLASSNPVIIGIRPFDINVSACVSPDDTENLFIATAPKLTVDKVKFTDDLTISQGIISDADPSVFDPAKAAVNRGCAVVKTGNNLYAYDGTGMHTVLFAGLDNDEGIDFTSEKVMGFYPNIPEAFAAINAKNVKTNTYTVVVLDDLDMDPKIALSFPANAKAASVCIRGYGIRKVISAGKAPSMNSNNIAFVNINFTAPTITTGNAFTLTLKDSDIYSKGKMTLGNVVNLGNSTIEADRVAKTNVCNLTINGTVTNIDPDYELDVQLNKIISAGYYSIESYRISDAKGLAAKNALLTAPKVKTGEVNFKDFNGGYFNEDTDSVGYGILVQSGGSFYYVSEDFAQDMVCLGIGDEAPSGNFLDLNQACAYINNMADRTADYTVYLGMILYPVLDVNVTDAVAHSAIVLPKTNMAHSLVLKSARDNDLPLMYSGNISGFAGAGGRLAFVDIALCPCDAKTGAGLDPAKTASNITLSRNAADKTGEVTLDLSDCTVHNTTYLNTISGTKGVTNVLIGSSLDLKTGFSNINTLTINGASDAVTVSTGGKSTIGTLHLMGSKSAFVTVGGATVDYLETDNNVVTNGFGPMIVAKPNGFTLNKTVKGEYTKVLVKLLSATDKTLSYTHLVYAVADAAAYLNKDLIIAPMADASRFIAAPYYNEALIVSYKSGKSVRNDDIRNIRLSVASNDGTLFAYAHDYVEAVNTIKTWNTKTAYTITFLNGASDWYKATTVAKGYGVFSFPAAANATELTIKGTTVNGNTTIVSYTGVINPAVPVIFENIVLDEGTLKGGVFTHSGTITLNSTLAPVEFKYDARNTDSNGNPGAMDILSFSKINAVKGLTLNGDIEGCSMKNVLVQDTANITSLTVSGTVNIDSPSGKAITITDIHSGTGTGDDKLLVVDSIAGNTLNTPMLQIKGNVDGTFGKIQIRLKKLFNGAWIDLTADEIEARLVKANDNANVLKTKVLSTNMQKVPADKIEIESLSDGAYVYKSGANLYITKQAMAVEVTDGKGYSGKYLSWADAVNDIDRRADKNANYTITLLDDVNKLNSNTTVTTIAFPKVAASVRITDGDNNFNMNFSNASLPVAANVTIDDVNLSCVKITKQKTSAGTMTYWNNVNYNVTISGNNTLTLNKGTYYNLTDVKGGILCVDGGACLVGTAPSVQKLIINNNSQVNPTKAASVKDLDINGGSSLSTSNGVNLTVQNSAIIGGGSFVSAENVTIKNLTLYGNSGVNGSNIVLSGRTVLSNGNINATRSKNKGTGKVTIADLFIAGNDNCITGKQDAAGKSLISVSGNVTRGGSVENVVKIGLLYNTSGGTNDNMIYAALTDGKQILTAPKADAQSFKISNNHSRYSNYNIVKSGNAMKASYINEA